jgi:hypothetical protein
MAQARATDDPDKARDLREGARALLDGLREVDPRAWPWADVQDAILTRVAYPVLVSKYQPPTPDNVPDIKRYVSRRFFFVWEGAAVTLVLPNGKTDQVEIGAIRPGEVLDKLPIRYANGTEWDTLAMFMVERWAQDLTPASFQAPLEEKPKGELREQLKRQLGYQNANDIAGRPWLASEAWRRWAWSALADEIEERILASAWSFDSAQIPVEDQGKLTIGRRALTEAKKRGGGVLPFTQEGFARFVKLVPASGLKKDEADRLALGWWGYKLPRGLFAEYEREQRALKEAERQQQAALFTLAPAADLAPAAPAPSTTTALPPAPIPAPIPAPTPAPRPATVPIPAPTPAPKDDLEELEGLLEGLSGGTSARERRAAAAAREAQVRVKALRGASAARALGLDELEGLLEGLAR